MTDRVYSRGAVVKGPDLFGPHAHRPYVCLSSDSPPFRDEEAVYAAVTTTRRPEAIPLADEEFISGGLPRECYVSPWVLTTIKHADIADTEGYLSDETVETIARAAGSHLGVFDRHSRRACPVDGVVALGGWHVERTRSVSSDPAPHV